MLIVVAVAVAVTDKDDPPPPHQEVVHTDHNDIDDNNDGGLPCTGFFESIITLSTDYDMYLTSLDFPFNNNSLNGKNIIIITHTNLNTFPTTSSIWLPSV